MEKTVDTEAMTIRGKISIKGNEPHTYLSLTTDNNIEYQLTGRYHDKIRDVYQQQTLPVKGKIEIDAIGPGFPALLDVQEIVFVSSE